MNNRLIVCGICEKIIDMDLQQFTAVYGYFLCPNCSFSEKKSMEESHQEGFFASNNKTFSFNPGKKA